MDQKSSSNNAVPVQPTIPEEDATLLAIEALEARSVDENPRALNAPRDVAVPERRAPTPAPRPKVIEPVTPKVIAPPAIVIPVKPVAPPKPIDTPKEVIGTSKPVQAKPAPVEVKPEPKAPATPVVPKKPKKPATPSEAMDEALASAPAPKRFQFFINQGVPRTPFIIIGSAVVVIGIGVAVYFATR